jgi:hypothetical protein
LIELLVVMAIIATLASLAISAVFTLRESQVKSFTETTVQKLASALDQQWKAVVDQIKDEPTPLWALTLSQDSAGRLDQRRARVIYLKARLKQEFPVTFAQALNPGGGVPGVDLKPKSTYAKALAGTSGTPPAWESSALLFLALSQGRSGMAAQSPEEMVEPTAIQTKTYSGKPFRIFVDSWANPLRYYSFPTGNTELNGAPYVKTPGAPDPQDPENTLSTRYPSPLNWPANATMKTYVETLLYTLPPSPTNLIPVVASAGRDGDWGDADAVNGPQYMLLTNAGASDNIYSYRLRRFGTRGD